MSSEIIKVLDELAKRFGIVIDWANENAMPYIEDLCKRIIDYDTAMSIITIAVLVAVTLISGIVALVSFNRYKKEESKDMWSDKAEMYMFIAIGAAIVFGIAAILSLAILPNEISNLAKNYYLPEARILEYLKGII